MTHRSRGVGLFMILTSFYVCDACERGKFRLVVVGYWQSAGPARSRAAQQAGRRARARRKKESAALRAAAAPAALLALVLLPSTPHPSSPLQIRRHAVAFCPRPPRLAQPGRPSCLSDSLWVIEARWAQADKSSPAPPPSTIGSPFAFVLVTFQPALARSLQTAADASTPATKVPEDANELVRISRAHRSCHCLGPGRF